MERRIIERTTQLEAINKRLAAEIAERKLAERRLIVQYVVGRILTVSTTFNEAASKIIQAGIGMPGRVWASGKPAWIIDVTKDTNFPRAPYADRVGLHSAFGFPIKLGRDVLGVIEFFSRKIRHTDNDMLDISFVLSKKSKYPPQNITIKLNKRQWMVNQLSEDRKFSVKIAGKDLSAGDNKMVVSVGYKDGNGKEYNASEELTINLANDSLFQRIILFFRHLI